MYYPQEIARLVDEVLGALNALQLFDKNGVAIPENRPNNHWLKDKVIVPPAAIEEQIKIRENQAIKGEIT